MWPVHYIWNVELAQNKQAHHYAFWEATGSPCCILPSWNLANIGICSTSTVLSKAGLDGGGVGTLCHEQGGGAKQVRRAKVPVPLHRARQTESQQVQEWQAMKGKLRVRKQHVKRTAHAVLRVHPIRSAGVKQKWPNRSDRQLEKEKFTIARN